MHYWCIFAVFVHELLIFSSANYDNDKRVKYLVSITSLCVYIDPAGCELIPKVTEMTNGNFRVEYLPCVVGEYAMPCW